MEPLRDVAPLRPVTGLPLGRRAEFNLRARCIACDSPEYRVVWEGRFDEIPATTHLRASFYSGDWEEALAGKAFELGEEAPAGQASAPPGSPRCGQPGHRRILASEWLEVLYTEWIDEAQIESFESEYSPLRVRTFDVGRYLAKHVLRLQSLLESPGRERAFRLVDYGCGSGAFVRMAVLFGFDAEGIDLSPSRRRIAAAHGAVVHESWEERDRHSPGPLDAVTLFEVLEHVPEPLELLREVTRRLRSGGVVIIEVPDATDVTSGERFEDFHKLNPLEHVNAFTPRTLDQLCRRAGLARVTKPVAHVTTRSSDVARTEAGRMAFPLRARGTAGYYRYFP